MMGHKYFLKCNYFKDTRKGGSCGEKGCEHAYFNLMNMLQRSKYTSTISLPCAMSHIDGYRLLGWFQVLAYIRLV
jgi:hypothetical protein